MPRTGQPTHTFRFYPKASAMFAGADNAGLTIIEIQMPFTDAVRFVEANHDYIGDLNESPATTALHALSYVDSHGVISFDLAYVQHWIENVLPESRADDPDDRRWTLKPVEEVPPSVWQQFLDTIAIHLDTGDHDLFERVDFDELHQHSFPHVFTEITT